MKTQELYVYKPTGELVLVEAYQEAIEVEYGDYSESMLGQKEIEILERIKKGANL